MSEKPAFKKYKFLYLILAGFLGTLAFYAAAYVDMAVTGVPLDITVVLGQLIAGEHESAQIVGHVAHFGNGIGLALFFGYVFLPISKKNNEGENMASRNNFWYTCNGYNCLVRIITCSRCWYSGIRDCTRSSNNDLN